MAKLTSDAVLNTAYEWLCQRRLDYPDHADIWDFRRHWAWHKDRIRSELISGVYRFALLERITLAKGEDIELWSARDALVLKALALVLCDVQPVSPQIGLQTAGHSASRLGAVAVRIISSR